MKISLTKDDVMGILCEHFSIQYTTKMGGDREPTYDKVYWEGNPE